MSERRDDRSVPPEPPQKPAARKSLSMHENVATWCDCCSCEAEPRWLEVAEELGIDLGSDYEEEREEAPDKQR